MRTPFLMVMVTAALLSGCAHKGQSTTQVASNLIQRQHILSTTDEHYPTKNARNIAVFSNDKLPNAAYRVIGVATISKYNLLGMQRQDETLNRMMKKLAASIGGDGIMNINTSEDKIQANIIAFQKILI